ncbi:hypothetical protein M569_00078 [Genlisea aurea]|uniref:Uncharacterized protein n=1 Tax=Genlisea aurea TaxID=192259 RepID=S8EF95_9LAMI|nr:hypothetical protein M569_00078 [Genlisea aurea]
MGVRVQTVRNRNSLGLLAPLIPLLTFREWRKGDLKACTKRSSYQGKPCLGLDQVSGQGRAIHYLFNLPMSVMLANRNSDKVKKGQSMFRVSASRSIA